MKILYAGFEYGAFRSGQLEKSFEDANFYASLVQLPGVEVDHYKLDRLREADGTTVSREIAERVRSADPDILFLFMNHDLDRNIFQRISHDTRTVTIAFFSDEDTDLYLRSLTWAGVFDWMVTFYPPAFEEYRRRGANVIGMNWAANTDFWKPISDMEPGGHAASAPARTIDASFIGAAKDERRAFVKKLLKLGVGVECWGGGWPNGPVSFERMREIIAQSKISLNLGFAKPILRPRSLARIFVSPGDSSDHNSLRGNSSSGDKYQLDLAGAGRNLKTILNRRRPQSRARPFELAASGAFVLTNRSAPLFGEPFVPDKEMVYYDGARDAAEKIHYYLAPEHEAERESIARAAARRARRDHSFKKRFADILSFISVDPKPKKPVAKIFS